MAAASSIVAAGLEEVGLLEVVGLVELAKAEAGLAEGPAGAVKAAVGSLVVGPAAALRREAG